METVTSARRRNQQCPVCGGWFNKLHQHAVREHLPWFVDPGSTSKCRSCPWKGSGLDAIQHRLHGTCNLHPPREDHLGEGPAASSGHTPCSDSCSDCASACESPASTRCCWCMNTTFRRSCTTTVILPPKIPSSERSSQQKSALWERRTRPSGTCAAGPCLLGL